MKPFDVAADEGSSVHSKKGVEVVVRVNEDQRATVALLRNGAGQPPLRWRSHDATALRVQRNGEACELRDGECSLYGYPVCELVPAEASKGKRVTRSLKEDELPVLEALMLALLRDDDAERYSLVHDDEDGRPQHRRPSWKGAGSKFLSPRGDKAAAAAAAAAPTKPNWERTMKRMDNFGACPIHGLLLGDSDAAVELARRMFEARPHLLTLTHGDMDKEYHSTAIFKGEGTIHIAAVNLREDLLCSMLETASKLSSEEIDRLYSTQAIGPFFHRLPMRHYGGTPLAYMACFGMKRAYFWRRCLCRRQFIQTSPVRTSLRGWTPTA